LYISIPTDAFVQIVHLHNSDTVYLANKFHTSRFVPHARMNVHNAYVIPCLAYLCFPTLPIYGTFMFCFGWRPITWHCNCYRLSVNLYFY